MKAVRFASFGGPEVLKLEDVATPAPGPGEVLIAIEAASVTPGDWKPNNSCAQRLPRLGRR